MTITEKLAERGLELAAPMQVPAGVVLLFNVPVEISAVIEFGD